MAGAWEGVWTAARLTGGPARAFPAGAVPGVSLQLRREPDFWSFVHVNSEGVRGHLGFDLIKCEIFTDVGGCHVGSASTKSPGDAWRREKVESHLLISRKEAALGQLDRRDFSWASGAVTFEMETPRVAELSGGGGGCVQRTQSWPHR